MYRGNWSWYCLLYTSLTYLMTLGKEGIPEASQNAVLNANYMMNKLKDLYTMAYEMCIRDRVSSGSLWDHSSAGRASALQAEGHRFEPYWSHYNLKVVSYIEYGWIPEWPKGTDCKSAA